MRYRHLLTFSTQKDAEHARSIVQDHVQSLAGSPVAAPSAASNTWELCYFTVTRHAGWMLIFLVHHTQPISADFNHVYRGTMTFKDDEEGSVMIFAGTDDHRMIAVVNQTLFPRLVREAVDEVLRTHDLRPFTVFQIAEEIGKRVHGNPAHYRVLPMCSR